MASRVELYLAAKGWAKSLIQAAGLCCRLDDLRFFCLIYYKKFVLANICFRRCKNFLDNKAAGLNFVYCCEEWILIWGRQKDVFGLRRQP